MMTSEINLKFLYLNLTFRCNHKCIFCVSDETVMLRKGGDYSDLPISSINEIISQLPDDIDTVHVSGGEPTLHDDFFAILDILNSRFKNIQIATNGVVLHSANYLDRILDICSPQFIIPIFSLRPEVHEHLTCANSLSHVLAGMKNVSDAQQEGKCSLAIKLLVMKLTIIDQEELLCGLPRLGIYPEEIMVSGLCRTSDAIANDMVIPFQEAKPYISSLARHIVRQNYLYCFHKIPLCAFDEDLWPYIITISKTSRKMEYATALSVYPTGERKDISPSQFSAIPCLGCDLNDYCEFTSNRNFDQFDYQKELFPIKLQERY